MTDYRTSRRRRAWPLITAAAILVAAGGGAIFILTRGDDPAPASSAPTVTAIATTTAPSAAAKPELRVADLMARLGCKGSVIGTQLYSKETGRCTLADVEVTIAVFESGDLRDQWVNAASQFGGNPVTGTGWAAIAANPDAAATAAEKLGGKRL